MNSFFTFIFGANWRTTISGWITVLASAIAVNPGLVAFLPDTTRHFVIGISGLLAVISGGTFAYHTKDKQVTGGSIQNNSNNPMPPSIIASLIVVILIFIFGFSGCAWITVHQQQIDDTFDVMGQRALAVAENVLLSSAIDEADKNFKADFLDSVASGLRANETTIVNSDDVAKIVKIWSPNDGTQWQQFAGSLGAIAGTALQSAGKNKSASIVENIATGLNNAAASARTTNT